MEKPKIVIEKSDKPLKKLKAVINGNKTVYFGANKSPGVPYLDYTLDKNPETKEMRKSRYIKRHAKMGEDWSKAGYDTPGFLSRWLLWGEPTLKKSIEETNKRFNLDIKYKK